MMRLSKWFFKSDVVRSKHLFLGQTNGAVETSHVRFPTTGAVQMWPESNFLKLLWALHTLLILRDDLTWGFLLWNKLFRCASPGFFSPWVNCCQSQPRSHQLPTADAGRNELLSVSQIYKEASSFQHTCKL